MEALNCQCCRFSFVCSRGLLLQESNRFSEALQYYKLAIGSRPTLACKYSSSFLLTISSSCGCGSAVSRQQRTRAVVMCREWSRWQKGSGCTAELNIQHSCVTDFSKPRCVNIMPDVMYYVFRNQCSHLFNSSYAHIYSHFLERLFFSWLPLITQNFPAFFSGNQIFHTHSFSLSD